MLVISSIHSKCTGIIERNENNLLSNASRSEEGRELHRVLHREDEVHNVMILGTKCEHFFSNLVHGHIVGLIVYK